MSTRGHGCREEMIRAYRSSVELCDQAAADRRVVELAERAPTSWRRLSFFFVPSLSREGCVGGCPPAPRHGGRRIEAVLDHQPIQRHARPERSRRIATLLRSAEGSTISRRARLKGHREQLSTPGSSANHPVVAYELAWLRISEHRTRLITRHVTGGGQVCASSPSSPPRPEAFHLVSLALNLRKK